MGFQRLDEAGAFLGDVVSFELLDFLVLGIFVGLGLTSVIEGGLAVLEELLEPAIDLVGMELELIAKIGNGNLINEVPFEDSDLLGAGKMTTSLVHAKPPYRLS